MDRLESLAGINLDDLVSAFGWQDQSRAATLARRVFRGPARTFARQMLDFDEDVSNCGLVEAAIIAERLHVRDVRVHGRQNVPTGPVLVLSNHPGMTDTLALFAALGRGDLRAIALNRPFLASLTNLRRHLLFLEPEFGARVGLMREAAGHLRHGGAVLTFPAGRNERDPDIYPDASASLRSWVDSAAVFLRLVPETLVLPVCVRGVLWSVAARNPLIGLRRAPDDQQLLASALQLLCQSLLNLRPVTVQIQIGSPIRAEQGHAGWQKSLHTAVLGEMKRLLENPPADEGLSAL